jgi:hypothetical protein
MMQKEKTLPVYLTPAAVCERWEGRIKLRTLHSWRMNGSGPPFTKIGGAVLYPTEKLVAWEERNTVHSTSEYGRGDKPPGKQK